MAEELKQDPQLVLQMVNKDREAGLERLQEKLTCLLESEKINIDNMPVEVVNATRDLVSAVNACQTVLQAHDKFCSMLVSDLIGLTRAFEEQGKTLFVTGSHLQVLLQLLQEKGQITEQEMKDLWEKMVSTLKKE
jgi:Asp-tRNA(Asn)/Glu-tRNA(Gln) amidotransferase B subunit